VLRLSFPGCLLLAVPSGVFWTSCPFPVLFPVPTVLFLAVLSQHSCSCPGRSPPALIMFSLSYPNFLLPAVLSRFSLPGCPVRIVLCRRSYAGVPALAVLPKLLNIRSNFSGTFSLFTQFLANFAEMKERKCLLRL
jgi:hypothetical protein